MQITRYLALFMFVLVTACAATGPTLSELGAEIPPLAAGKSRIYFYRLLVLEGSAIQPQVRVDGEVVGRAVPRGVFLVDVDPGKHVVSITADDKLILPLVVRMGEESYVRMATEPSFWTTNIRPVAVDVEVGKHETKALSFVTD